MDHCWLNQQQLYHQQHQQQQQQHNQQQQQRQHEQQQPPTPHCYKSQTKFGIVDNSKDPFVPKLRRKVNALVHLELTLTSKGEYNHPYDYEIRSLKHKMEDLAIVSPCPVVPLHDTILHYIDSKDELDRLITYLRSVKEIAVDVEQHSERSYQGFSCLVQISTRNEDFIIDPLVLYDHMDLLNDVFTNPHITKIVHGADDTLWLQRDFGVYIVNLFDTQCAARELGLTLGLGFLLKTYFNFDSAKEFQTADWRVRPLPPDMREYARTDTHFLMPLYDLLKNELLRKSTSVDPRGLPECNCNNNLLFAARDASAKSSLRHYSKKQQSANPLHDTNFKIGFKKYLERNPGLIFDAEMVSLVL